MPDFFSDLFDNYFCYSNTCDYITNCSNEKESFIQLTKDGGFFSDTETFCPKCKRKNTIMIVND